MNANRPNWHTEESWRIEFLDWENSSNDFAEIRKYVLDRLRSDLGYQTEEILAYFKDQEFDDAIKRGLFLYSDAQKKIGKAIHIVLWMRDQIGQRC